VFIFSWSFFLFLILFCSVFTVHVFCLYVKISFFRLFVFSPLLYSSICTNTVIKVLARIKKWIWDDRMIGKVRQSVELFSYSIWLLFAFLLLFTIF
jgi:hypothetical protein